MNKVVVDKRDFLDFDYVRKLPYNCFKNIIILHLSLYLNC